MTYWKSPYSYVHNFFYATPEIMKGMTIPHYHGVTLLSS